MGMDWIYVAQDDIQKVGGELMEHPSHYQLLK
jgi:hypothetical protein